MNRSIPFGTTFVLDSAISKIACNFHDNDIPNLERELNRFTHQTDVFQARTEKQLDRYKVIFICDRDNYGRVMDILRFYQMTYKIKKLQKDREHLVTWRTLTSTM